MPLHNLYWEAFTEPPCKSLFLFYLKKVSIWTPSLFHVGYLAKNTYVQKKRRQNLAPYRFLKNQNVPSFIEYFNFRSCCVCKNIYNKQAS